MSWFHATKRSSLRRTRSQYTNPACQPARLVFSVIDVSTHVVGKSRVGIGRTTKIMTRNLADGAERLVHDDWITAQRESAACRSEFSFSAACSALTTSLFSSSFSACRVDASWSGADRARGMNQPQRKQATHLVC